VKKPPATKFTGRVKVPPVTTRGGGGGGWVVGGVTVGPLVPPPPQAGSASAAVARQARRSLAPLVIGSDMGFALPPLLYARRATVEGAERYSTPPRPGPRSSGPFSGPGSWVAVAVSVGTDVSAAVVPGGCASLPAGFFDEDRGRCGSVAEFTAMLRSGSGESGLIGFAM
jgi:hypothetical protein